MRPQKASRRGLLSIPDRERAAPTPTLCHRHGPHTFPDALPTVTDVTPTLHSTQTCAWLQARGQPGPTAFTGPRRELKLTR